MTQENERRYLVVVVGMLAGPRAGGRGVSSVQVAAIELSLHRATKPDYDLTWTDEQAVADARQRLEIMLEFGSAMGMRISGDVARTDDPVDAVREAADGFDEMIVIDNPHGLKRSRSEKALAELGADPGLPLRHFRANPPSSRVCSSTRPNSAFTSNGSSRI